MASPAGIGFVEMTEQAQAQAAIKSLNGKERMGKQMSVNETRPRTDQGRSGSQGGQMDYRGHRNRYSLGFRRKEVDS
jgi:cold-inducible RNA-binding protein